MPRIIDPELLDCLRRPNPYVQYIIEVSEPDVGQVLRRPDQFLNAPTLVSQSPAASLAASARGGLILAPTTAALATFAGTQSSFDLNAEDPNRRLKGVSWSIDSAFSRATLKSVLAKVQAVALAGFFFDQDFELQIFQIVRTPGIKVKNPGTPQYQQTAFVQYDFAPLLVPAPIVHVTAANWGSNTIQQLNFDLSNYRLVLENIPTRAVTPDQAGILPKYLIVVRLAGKQIGGTGHYKWLLDTLTAHAVGGIGTFDRVFWAKASDDAQWVETLSADVPNITINYESYPASGQFVFLVDQGAAPKATSTGRVEFQRSLPPGTAAGLELSTAGTGGPWTPVKHGDSLAQRTNYAKWADDVTNPVWNLNAAASLVTADTDTAPDGTVTADSIVDNPANANSPWVLQQAVIPTGVPVTFSWYLKKVAGTLISLALWDNVHGFYEKDVTSQLSATEYRRVSITATLDPTSTLQGWGIGQITSTDRNLRVWHAQMELGSVPTDFIPTTSAPVVFGGAQQTYHLRTTLTSDTPHRATPEVIAQGVEFRTPIDVSIEAVAALPVREIGMPWPKASIPEGSMRIVRAGIRDYLDFGTQLGSTAAVSRLEADIFLASHHPSITRDKWLRLERMLVSSRQPSTTSESLSLLSYASRLKRKIPQKVETINSVHVVASSTTGQVVVVGSALLPGTTIGGNEYDGKNYYMRVRSSAAANIPAGFVAVIQGSTDTTKLDFTPALPQALVAGDVIEVHSGIFQTQAVSWSDYDPADVWYEVLTNLLAIPPERIGLGSLPRGGRPPKVADIAPGDATTQAKRRVTGRINEEVEGDKVIDVVSAILGGVTLEVDGQIVFVQLLPLTDIASVVTVPLPPPAAFFDLRDFASPPQTPLGLESRATIVTAKYGVPATAAQPDSFPSKATTAVDQDALLWFAQQDIEDFGNRDVPDEVSSWLYNTTDEGLYLASVLGAQLVRATSTGLRVFNLQMAEKHPHLVPGDVIVIATDGYTDYDPATQLQIKGPLTIRGVLVRVGNEGRDLSMFVPGLRDNVQLVKGGATGALTGLGTQPAPPALTASFDAAGHIVINSAGDFATASQKIAFATIAPPSAATVRAQTPIAGQIVSGSVSVAVFAPGDTVYIAAFAYSANGLESTPLAVISVTRETGTPDPPVPTIVPLNGETDDTIRILQFNATAGTGGGGANLTYDVRIKVGFAAETSLASGNATTLPLTINVARHIRNDKYIRFIVTDTATGLTRTAYYDIPSQRQEIDDTIPSRLTSAVTHSGGTGVNRLLAKTLPADPDNADSVLAGLNKRIPLIGATDSSGNVDMAGVSWVNRNADNLGRSAGDATHVAVIVDRLTNLGNAASNMQESGGKAVNRLLGKALAADPDSLDGAPDGVTYKRVVSVVSGQITPASSTSRNRCKVVQTITLANNTPTFFTPTTEAYDTGNLHDTATSPSHITVPAGGNTGAWLLHGTVDFAANAAGYRSVGIYKNGVLVESSTLPPATGVLTSIPVSFLDDAPAVGDYYELLATQTSGGNLSTTGTFTAIHLW